MQTTLKTAICCIALLLGTADLGTADPIPWPINAGGNGHYYEYVAAPTIDWETAQRDALGARWLGMIGHLATLTSQAELDFVLSNLAPPDDTWIGAEHSNDGFRWVSYYESWGPYTNWCAGEPNLIPLQWAKVALMNNGCWVDHDRFDAAPGYIVEFEEDWIVGVEDRAWGAIKRLYQ